LIHGLAILVLLIKRINFLPHISSIQNLISSYLSSIGVFNSDSVFLLLHFYYHINCNVQIPLEKMQQMKLNCMSLLLFLLFVLYKGLMIEKLISPKHVACTSTRKYILCVTENLALFLYWTVHEGMYFI